MKKLLLVSCVFAALLGSLSSTVAAKDWNVHRYTNQLDNGINVELWFEFSGNELGLHGFSWTPSDSDLPPTPAFFEPIVGTDGLSLYGTWAVCGTVANNQLIRDPYATFVETDKGRGYIKWAANTPSRYVAPLMLGAVFEGNGCHSAVSATGASFSSTIMGFNYDAASTYCDPGSYTFYATAPVSVPEPASILTLLVGVGSVAGYAIRRRK